MGWLSFLPQDKKKTCNGFSKIFGFNVILYQEKN